MTRFVLASASPRRRELLSLLGVEFEVRPVDIDESFGRTRDPLIVARRLAREKAEAARLADERSAIITADTIVFFDGQMLGKPADAEEARQMLRMLRGKTHEVVTGVALMPENRRAVMARQPLTRVTMRDYSDADIESSIVRGEPFDKAGGYAIQDEALRPIARYEGCYCNVMGLPLWPLIDLMRKAGTPIVVKLEQLLAQCGSCPYLLMGR